MAEEKRLEDAEGRPAQFRWYGAALALCLDRHRFPPEESPCLECQIAAAHEWGEEYL